MITRNGLDQAAESVYAKLLARYVMPFAVVALLGIFGWLMPRWIDGLEKNIDLKVQQVQIQVDAIKTEQLRRTDYFGKISDTLLSIQQASSAQQATASAQYQELKEDSKDNSRRIDRLEDRLNIPGR